MAGNIPSHVVNNMQCSLQFNMQCTFNACCSTVTAVAFAAYDCIVISAVFDWLSSENNNDLLGADHGLQTGPDLLKRGLFLMHNFNTSSFTCS